VNRQVHGGYSGKETLHMHKHFMVLLIGSLLFALLFLWQTRFMGHAPGQEGAIMVFGIAMRNAIRVVFLYSVFVVLVFGHHFFGGGGKSS
jgi:hypothetical protein